MNQRNIRDYGKMPNKSSKKNLREFGFLLRDVTRLYVKNFERLSDHLGWTLDQCRVLGNLERNEGISQTRLAYLTDTDPMTLGRLLDRMTAEGLIERRPDPADRRANRLYLMPAAKSVLEEIWRVADQARDEALDGISDAECTTFLELLRRAQSNLDALMPDLADKNSTGGRIGKSLPRTTKK